MDLYILTVFRWKTNSANWIGASVARFYDCCHICSKIAVFWDVRPYQCGGSVSPFKRILLQAVRFFETSVYQTARWHKRRVTAVRTSDAYNFVINAVVLLLAFHIFMVWSTIVTRGHQMLVYMLFVFQDQLCLLEILWGPVTSVVL